MMLRSISGYTPERNLSQKHLRGRFELPEAGVEGAAIKTCGARDRAVPLSLILSGIAT